MAYVTHPPQTCEPLHGNLSVRGKARHCRQVQDCGECGGGGGGQLRLESAFDHTGHNALRIPMRYYEGITGGFQGSDPVAAMSE